MSRSISSNVATVNNSDVAAGFRRLMPPLLPWIIGVLVLVCVQQLSDSLAQALVLGGLAAPLVISILMWMNRGGPCLPVLPLVLLINFLVFGLSILLFDSQALPEPLLDLVSLPLLLWPSMLLIGWSVVPTPWLRRRPQPPLLQALDSQQLLPHLLLGSALLVQTLLNSGVIWELLGPSAVGLTNPLQTFMTLLTLPGAFVGAFLWGRNRLREPAVFWLLVIIYFTGFLLSFLLSAAQNLVIALLLGLWLGRARSALPITLALVALLAFLHPGKAEMRAKYWNSTLSRPSPPELLVEWIGASYNATFTPQVDKESQGLDKRLANLAMLIYVNVQQQRGFLPLDGATYSIIPEILIPRFLTPNKVRAQEGQVMLNLHYGRQASREETERTYISWGLLPEAVGNYGPLLGPLVVGFLFGSMIRLVELTGADQDLLSKPGLQSLILGVLLIGSYEMVASTLVAACFQSFLMVEGLNLYLRQQR